MFCLHNFNIGNRPGIDLYIIEIFCSMEHFFKPFKKNVIPNHFGSFDLYQYICTVIFFYKSKKLLNEDFNPGKDLSVCRKR